MTSKNNAHVIDGVQDDHVQDEKVGRLRLENDSVLIVASDFLFGVEKYQMLLILSHISVIGMRVFLG